MSLIQKMKDKWKQNRLRKTIGVAPDVPGYVRSDDASQWRPVIETQWGNVSEPARLQAALNMKADPAKRQAVEELLGRKLGSASAGVAESRRRYAEAYQDEETT